MGCVPVISSISKMRSVSDMGCYNKSPNSDERNEPRPMDGDEETKQVQTVSPGYTL